ncbi:hypothetical protein G5V58_00665 [Nocardioides anomalus]|uniref:Uncharacterized protein n=1 Tax=Nocardioides anomalus TaxID=2712223 RepID=A0A6G6W8E5_9ACTN|nr:hypothetical protein [Nocardioides anomalus]QIG41479.1 hypothetical protein G5V58_00665 [Nocardioides anomalus]
MDPSALIFVALAVAWAVYLIPKALEHHEESVRTRTVDRFSKTMRVLARREPINRRKARLVTKADAADPELRTATRPAPAVAAPERVQPSAAARAARRRLRVVTLILIANAAVVALAAFHVVAWVWCAAPVGVLAVWLVACRLMVKRERAAARPRRRITAEPVERPSEQRDPTEEVAVVEAPVAEEAPRDPDAWDPVYAPLPTYVSAPVARRTVSTIDLDSTGVWSSGRNASDSRLAREAEAAEAAERPTSKSERRASGA